MTEGQNCFYKNEGVIDPLDVCIEGEPLFPKVPSGKIDILFDPPIYLGNGKDQFIVFDFLPAESILITETGMGKPYSYILRPVIHAYTMDTFMDENDWDYLRIEEVEGIVDKISDCDDPDAPDMLTLSLENGGGTLSIDITDATISSDGSIESLSCGSIHPGQEVEIKVSVSGDGITVAETVEIED